MGVTFATFTNGTAMVAADVQTELDKGFTFVNGGVKNTDMASATLDSHHIMRPEVYGFPVNAGMQQTSRLYHAQAQATGGNRDARLSTNRVDIIVQALQGSNNAFPVHTMMRTIDVPTTSDIHIQAGWSVMKYSVSAVHDPSGHFVLCSRIRATGTVTTFLYSQRNIHSNNNYARTVYNTGATFGSAGGANTYDIWLEYRLGSAYADVRHIVVDHAAMSIIIERTG